MSPNIFEYANLQDYLVAILHDRQTSHPNFSLRNWATQLGYKNPSLLSDVLNGKRKPPAKMTSELQKNLVHNTEEKKYFVLMVGMAGAKTNQEKIIFQSLMLEQTSCRATTSLDLDKFQLINDWYHLAIMEMVDLADFNEDSSYIADRLKKTVPKQVIESAINRLIKLGLLIRDKNKRLIKSNKNLFIGKEIKSEAIQKHHHQLLDLAKDALAEPVEDREVSTSYIAIKNTDMKKLKDLVHEFHVKVNELSCSGYADNVVAVSVQGFRLTEQL